MKTRAGDLVVEQLETRLGFGRSSKYGFRRHRIMRAAEYEAALLKTTAPAERGRLLRLLGRTREARACLGGVDAASCAYRWELGLAEAVLRERVDFADIDRAVALEPRNPVWLVWRAIGRLSNAPYSKSRRLEASKRRRLAAASEAALDDLRAALALDRGFALGYVARALAFENLGRPRDVLENLTQALRREPREAWLHEYRSAVRRKLGDAAGFLADCEEAILLDEGSAFVHWTRGGEYGRLPQDAVLQADRALAREPNAYWMLVFRGECRRSPPLNQFTLAQKDFEAAVALRPRCSWAWAYLAKGRMANGDAEGALEAIGTAVRLRGDCGWFHVWRGEIKRRLGDLKGARAAFDRGLALDPDYELGYAWRGGLHRACGRLGPALRDLDLAVRLDSRHPWPLHERFLVLRSLGRFEEAFRDLEAACKLDPKFAYCRDRARLPQAVAELGRELRRHPRLSWGWAWRGEMKLTQGDYRGAAADLERCLALDPRNAWARAWLGRTLACLALKRRAARELDRAVKLDPSYANARAWRGRLKHEAGRFKDALRDLDAAARLDPRSAWILEWRAQAKQRLGRFADAARDFSLSLDLNRRNGRALLGRALALEKSGRRRESAEGLQAAVAEAARLGDCGRVDEALSLFAEIVDAVPDFADAHYWRGRCLCGLGRCVEAQSSFARALALEPRHVWALIASGVCLGKSGRREEGGRRLAEARRLSPQLFERREALA